MATFDNSQLCQIPCGAPHNGLLVRTLLETQWNVTETARRLDLARQHVYNLIHTFELKRGDGEEA